MSNHEIVTPADMYTERGSAGAFVEFDTMPDGPIEALRVFEPGNRYDGMLKPKEVETIRRQISVTATESNPFGWNFRFSPNTDGSFFAEIFTLRDL